MPSSHRLRSYGLCDLTAKATELPSPGCTQKATLHLRHTMGCPRDREASGEETAECAKPSICS